MPMPILSLRREPFRSVDRMLFGQWLKEQRAAVRITQEDLGEKIGRSKGLISQLEKVNQSTGKPITPSPEILNSIAEALKHFGSDVTLEDVWRAAGAPIAAPTREVDPPPIDSPCLDSASIEESVSIAARFGTVVRKGGPLLGGVPAGIPVRIDGKGREDGDPILQAYGGDYYLIARGDSMIPDVGDGEILIVKVSDLLAVGRIVIALVDGDSVCKRLTSATTNDDGEMIVTLTPSNSKYAAIKHSDIRIQGIVVHKLTPGPA